MKKLTMKQQVLQFVESNGSARYVDIIKFIVDTKFGTGTYDSGVKIQPTWVWNKKLSQGETKPRRKNEWRGYYSGAFSATKYFLKGSDHLMKVTNPSSPAYNKYITFRNNTITIKA